MKNVDTTVFLTMGGANSPYLNHGELLKPSIQSMGGF